MRSWGVFAPENCPDAIALIDKIFIEAITSGRHKCGDWREADNTARFLLHLSKWKTGGQSEDHLANLACRALCLLQLRIEREEREARMQREAFRRRARGIDRSALGAQNGD